MHTGKNKRKPPKPKHRDQMAMEVTTKAMVTKPKLKQAVVANGGNVVAAAQDVGVSEGYARKLMPAVRDELLGELRIAGAGPDKVARVINDALDAEKIIGLKSGDDDELVPVGIPDHATRLRAVAIHNKITGAVAPSRSIGLVGHQQLPASEETSQERIDERMAALNEAHKRMDDDRQRTA